MEQMIKLWVLFAYLKRDTMQLDIRSIHQLPFRNNDIYYNNSNNKF